MDYSTPAPARTAGGHQSPVPSRRTKLVFESERQVLRGVPPGRIREQEQRMLSHPEGGAGAEGEAGGQPRAVDVKPARLHGRLDLQRLAFLHEAGFQRRAPALDAVELAGAELEPVLADRHRLAARGAVASRASTETVSGVTLKPARASCTATTVSSCSRAASSTSPARPSRERASRPAIPLREATGVLTTKTQGERRLSEGGVGTRGEYRSLGLQWIHGKTQSLRRGDRLHRQGRKPWDGGRVPSLGGGQGPGRGSRHP